MAASKPFVHLHCHTDYSLLDGACEISQLMDIVSDLGQPAVGMTDHGNLFGAVQFYNAAKAKGVHPVIGCEVYVAQESHTSRSTTDRYNHLLLLCESQEGYRNLIKLASTAYLDGFYYKPRVDKALLAQHSKGLIAFSACLRGDLNEAMLADKYDEGRRLAYTYQDIFGRDNFFLEIQDHGLEQDRRLIPLVNRLSQESGIPLIATNDSHYLRKDDSRAHEILMCISSGKTISDPNRLRFDHPEFYLKSRDEMMKIFGDFEDALDRTWTVADRCRIKLEKVKDPFPVFDVPPEHTLDSYFAWVARMGFEKRRPRLEAARAQGRLKRDIPEYIERLEFEISMIQKMKFSGYFLIVWDFIRFAKSKNIPVGPGRGSAAGSLVGYAMEITNIDPLQYDLLFERFLNPERVSMPDIDTDFCTRGRGEVIKYVTEKYGREQVAQIITFGTLGAKAALKDVARVLEFSFADADKLTKLVPPVLNIGLKDSFAKEPEFARLAKEDPKTQEILDTAVRLEGFARNSSVHAAGVVISPEPLRDLVPLYKTNKDEVVTQFDMNALDKLGLLKFDFLGLITLTLLDDTVALIKRHRGVDIVLEDIALDDPKTYETVFHTGETSGIFQFESDGMRDVLRRYKPERVEDLTALNALYRPGPIQGGVIGDFIDRKHGRKKVTYDFPELEPLLSETYGIILYQEQVMRIASTIAGYSLGEADMLRRAMGKKKKEEMDAQRERFLKGASERGFHKKKAEDLFDLMAKFAEYGFNKSHSAAYAYLAYLTAWLKTHYKIEFMSALLTSETGKADKVVKYINECRSLKIEVKPPDVNSSDFDFTPDGDAIRFGLGAVKNIGANAVEAIKAARTKLGAPFKSIYQFCEEVDLTNVNKRVIESLIRSGAMDTLDGNRAQKFAAADSALESGQRAWADRLSGQTGLFGDMLDSHAEQPLPNVNDWPARDKLTGEKEMLGFYVSGHPLDDHRDRIADLTTHTTANLEGMAKGVEVKLCGMISSIARKRNKEGKPWASMQFEDLEGSLEALLFATGYERLGAQLAEDKAVYLRALILPEESGPPKLSVQEIVPLENAYVAYPSLISIKVRLGRGEPGAELHDLFTRKPGPAQVRLRLEQPRDFSVILDVPAKVKPDREFLAAVERLCGSDAYEVLSQ